MEVLQKNAYVKNVIKKCNPSSTSKSIKCATCGFVNGMDNF